MPITDGPADDTSTATHWDRVWAGRTPEEVTWYQAEPRTSLELIDRAAPTPAAVVDIGGGASRLAGRLLDRGHTVAVVDVASGSLDAARAQLGARANDVHWVVADVRGWTPERTFDLWHDRAVFHFLTAERDRLAYLAVLRAALRPGGHLVLATFGPNGPEMCSGLEVRRYDRDLMTTTLGPDFTPVAFVDESHTAPSGATQEFLYGLFRRAG